MLQATPATYHLLLEAGWRGNDQLKTLVGGEALPQDLANRLLQCGASLWIFSPQEQAALRAISDPDLKRWAFFDCWTRKEAYIKARGEGLSLPLDRFDVSLAPGKPARLLDHRDNPAECGRWSLIDSTVEPGFAATLAVAGQGWQLAYLEWLSEVEIRRLHENHQC